MVRARCGNRIEVKKPQPLPALVVPPDVPPPDIALETGLPSLMPPTVTPPVLPASQLAKNDGAPVSRISTPPTTWCCGLTSSTLPSVPEPPSFLLVFAGGLFIVSMVLGKKLL
jgi:hypothetical protein